MKEPKKFVSAISKRPEHPSNYSSSDSESELAKLPIPPQSAKWPTTVASTTDSKQSIITLIKNSNQSQYLSGMEI